jgi:hypothetical protein
MFEEGLNKSDGEKIPTVILFTEHVRKMSLQSDKGTEQVRWTRLDLEQVQPVWPVCNIGLTGKTDFSTLLEFSSLSSFLESL